MLLSNCMMKEQLGHLIRFWSVFHGNQIMTALTLPGIPIGCNRVVLWLYTVFLYMYGLKGYENYTSRQTSHPGWPHAGKVNSYHHPPYFRKPVGTVLAITDMTCSLSAALSCSTSEIKHLQCWMLLQWPQQ